MNVRYLFLLVILWYAGSGWMHAQSFQAEVEEWSKRSPTEQGYFIHTLELEEKDSASFMEMYQSLTGFADEAGGFLMQWNLDYYCFVQRGRLKTSPTETIDLLTKLERIAVENDFTVGRIVAQHHLYFANYYRQKISKGAQFVHILQEVEQFQQVGFEQFSNYQLDWMLYRNARFMYQLGDLDEALRILRLAEQYIKPTEKDRHTYVLVLNHLQAVYQMQNQLDQAIAYAEQIYQFVIHPQTRDAFRLLFYQQWEGLVSSDLAYMHLEQGSLQEAKIYAERSYELAKAHSKEDSIAVQMEYDALPVIIHTKLKINETEEVRPLLDRYEELYEIVGRNRLNYFNNISYYECQKMYHEKQGEFAEALRFSNLIRPLQDSLNRQNDARKLEQLKQQRAVEKYQKEIQVVEEERAYYRTLWIVGISTFAIVLLAAILYFSYLNRQRKQRAASLENTRKELEKLTQQFQEKAAETEKIRLEMETIAQLSNQTELVEQLIKKTILTEKDWLDFKHLFEKVYPGFINAQNTKYPNLTPSELRYLLLDKLGLRTKEMANMLGVSDSAIRKTRSRVKKKLAQ